MNITFTNISWLPGLLLMASLSNGGEHCYRYSPDHYALIHTYADPKGKIIDETLSPSMYDFYLVVPEHLDRLYRHTFVLSETKSGNVLESNTMECYPFRGTTGGYECQGECDSGHVLAGAHARLRSKNGLLFGETIDAPEGTWDLTWRSPGTLLLPEEVPCSPQLAQYARTTVEVDESYARKHERFALRPYLNVCYSQKDMRLVNGEIQPLYVDCEIGHYSCERMGMKRFGHYPSEQSSRNALIRCQHSMPLKKRD